MKGRAHPGHLVHTAKPPPPTPESYDPWSQNGEIAPNKLGRK